MKKRIMSALLALALCLGLAPAAFAADIQPLSEPNQGRYDYTSNPFSQTSNLYVNPSGGVTRVEKIGGGTIYYFDNGQMKSYVQPQELVIEDYSSSFQLQSKKTPFPWSWICGAGFTSPTITSLQSWARKTRAKATALK